MATPLTGRKTVILQNRGNKAIYIGDSAGVTTANGVCLPKNGSMEFKFGEVLNVFAIAPSGSQDLRIIEAA